MKWRAKKYRKGGSGFGTGRIPEVVHIPWATRVSRQKRLGRGTARLPGRFPFVQFSIFSIVLSVFLIVCTIGCAPKCALAAPTYIEGMCYIECTNPEIDGAAGGNTFMVSFPQYGIETTGYCTSGPMYGTPVPGHYPFTGTRMESGSYSIVVDCTNAEMYPNHYSQLGAQNVGNFTIDIFGTVELLKHSIEGYAHAAAGASLANARYELRDLNGDLCAVMTTDENGWAAAYDISIGTYTLHETKPSFGYGLDEEIHTFVVNGGKTTHVESQEGALYGAIAIKKASSYPAITQGNPAYSLKCATYGVYSDAACENIVQHIATDETGYGQSEACLLPGMYWIKELKAPLGYVLDEQIYPAVLSIEDCCRKAIPCINTFDTPQLAPAEIIVKKIDGERGGAQAQGDATLAGATFLVEHYAAVFATYDEVGNAGLKPTFSDTVITDAQGIAHIAPTLLPRTHAGFGFALGTLVIREITPPDGYMLPEQNTFVCPVTPVGPFPLDGMFCVPTVAEQVIRGDIALIKTGDGEGTTGEQNSKQPLANVAFDIIHAQSQKTVARIVTDENGFASTASSEAAGGTAALPFGTYLVQEDPATTPAGYRPAPAFPVTIAENNRTYSYAVENTTGTIVRVIKQDAETGRRIAGHMTFRILNESGEALSFMVPEISDEPLTSFTTDDEGVCTLPCKINGGETYYIQEIQPPCGYTLNDELVPFSLSAPDENGENRVLEVVVQNSPQTVCIKLQKTDAETNTFISQANITWDIQAAADIITADGTIRAHEKEVVAQITSDENGEACLEGLYPGSYEIIETQAPYGYVCLSKPTPVELLYGDPSLSCVEKDIAIENQRAKGMIEIQKTNRENGEPLLGATYEIRAAADIIAPDNIVVFCAGEAVEVLTTDEAGCACSKELPLGIYDVVETKAPAGYEINTHTYRIELTYQGQDVACVKESLAVDDKPLPAPLPGISIPKTGDCPRSLPFVLSAQGALLLCACSLYGHAKAKKLQDAAKKQG